MKLIDGLKEYENSSYFQGAEKLEKDGAKVLLLVENYGGYPNPPPEVLKKVKDFLIEVEKWKTPNAKDYWAHSNEDESIWSALLNASNANDDSEKLLAIMKLSGFGKSNKSAKVASAVLRFLWPEKWGVVDWRIAAMFEIMTEGFEDNDPASYIKDDYSNIVEKAKAKAKFDFDKKYKFIYAADARKHVHKYRCMCEKIEQINRAADADMAIFGLSLKAWPMY